MLEKPPNMSEYYGKGDLNEHIQLVNDCLNYFRADEAYKCELFALTLIRSSKIWFNALLDGSTES